MKKLGKDKRDRSSSAVSTTRKARNKKQSRSFRTLSMPLGPGFRCSIANTTNAKQIPMLPDWAIIDTSTPPNDRSPGRIVRAGFFNEQWK